MTVNHDTVITVAIGAETPNGTLLPNDLKAAAKAVRLAIEAVGGTVVAMTYGEGVASDDDRLGTPEATAVVLAINTNPDLGEYLRFRIADILRAFEMTSACYAVDSRHEPVFNTSDGSRPTD